MTAQITEQIGKTATKDTHYIKYIGISKAVSLNEAIH